MPLFCETQSHVEKKYSKQQTIKLYFNLINCIEKLRLPKWRKSANFNDFNTTKKSTGPPSGRCESKRNKKQANK